MCVNGGKVIEAVRFGELLELFGLLAADAILPEIATYDTLAVQAVPVPAAGCAVRKVVTVEAIVALAASVLHVTEHL